MQYVLNQDSCQYSAYINYSNDNFDVNIDGVIDSADVAEIVQKSLDSGYLMPCER